MLKWAWEERRLNRQVQRSYPHFSLDSYLRRLYLMTNPYRVHRRFCKSKKTSPIYGETPLQAYALLAHHLNLSHEDTFIELGCGRGRGLFFLNHLTGCLAIGVERIPLFVKKAFQVIERYQLGHQVKIIVGDFLEKLPTSSGRAVFYLYGTTLSAQEIQRLICQLRSYSKNSIYLTVSYPLSDYSAAFCTEKAFTLPFLWGRTTVYLQSQLSHPHK